MRSKKKTYIVEQIIRPGDFKKRYFNIFLKSNKARFKVETNKLVNKIFKEKRKGKRNASSFVSQLSMECVAQIFALHL